MLPQTDREILTSLVNGLWTAYNMGEIYNNWKDSGLSQNTIVIHKCTLSLPQALVYPFRLAWIQLKGEL